MYLLASLSNGKQLKERYGCFWTQQEHPGAKTFKGWRKRKCQKSCSDPCTRESVVPLPWQRPLSVFVNLKGEFKSLFCSTPCHKTMFVFFKKKEKYLIFKILMNSMVDNVYKGITMWAGQFPLTAEQFVCSSWNIVICLPHRLFGGWRSKTPCSRLGIDLPCGCSTNRFHVSAKLFFIPTQTRKPTHRNHWFK